MGMLESTLRGFILALSFDITKVQQIYEIYKGKSLLIRNFPQKSQKGVL